MDDLISNRAAVDALERIFDRCEEIEAHFPDGDPDKTGYKMFPDYMTVWKYLHQLPSAERRGRWIIDKEFSNIGRCSFCGDRWGSVDQMNYCPSCGAKMGER